MEFLREIRDMLYDCIIFMIRSLWWVLKKILKAILGEIFACLTIIAFFVFLSFVINSELRVFFIFSLLLVVICFYFYYKYRTRIKIHLNNKRYLGFFKWRFWK
ncbi:hypothetical protein Xmau_03315 [Xenorhabdus mauleonii]|uniref:Uncharacterized protein n=1 Tax=Xenorhabdus mauleonii TaxID=351675 RepID=A0A1I3WEW9_9GAMM|nr:hypothetical protein Xmau_03315 [Xenorhabdus mauleonii]SFK05940.1 hypothetical protein SAMN05421680_12612 [Xenorhabdus mauleonii]